MRFVETKLKGAFLVTPDLVSDDRGFFARMFCAQEFADKGLNHQLVQCNIAFNTKKGTLRGMHFQHAPHAEVKLIRCTQGAIFDVIVDIRPKSETFSQWFGVELSAENRNALYVPEGFAHGYITLSDNTEILYQVSAFYNPSSEGGLNWNDPRVNVVWPIIPTVISEKDHKQPYL